MRLFQAALDTPLDSPFSATLSVHGLHFTVRAPSILLEGLLQVLVGAGVCGWKSGHNPKSCCNDGLKFAEEP